MEQCDLFLLTAEHRDENSENQLHFFGKSADLGAVELIFDQTHPIFFVDAEEKLPMLDFDFERKPLKLTSMRGRSVDGLYFKTGRDQRVADDRFRATGVRHFEAKVRPAERFLMERFINVMTRVAGECKKKGKLTTFLNPKIKASSAATPPLSQVSVDIECGVSDSKLYSIGVHFKDSNREEKHVFMLADHRRKVHGELTFLPSQRELLVAFCGWMADYDPDLIIGWHVVGFDLMYLERKCRDLSMTLDIARGKGRVLLIDKPGVGSFSNISGRVVIDGIPAMRGCGFTFPNNKLETVARTLLQTGKLIASDHNKVSEIERQFREDKEALAKYNLEDCVLVTRIFEKVELIPLMIERSRTSGMMMDQLGLPTGALDHYYLPRLHRKGMVASTADGMTIPINRSEDSVSDPKPGSYSQVALLDFVNVLPSLIRVFKIDPLARIKADVNPVMMPSGQSFSGTEHLLPAFFENLMDRQATARQQDNLTLAKACDLTMKQVCGALYHKNCRFNDPDLQLALAAAENWLVKQSVAHLEEEGYQVLFADSEMLLVLLKGTEDAGAGQKLAALLNGYWQDKLQAEYGLSSIEVTLSAVYRKLVIPPLRKKEGQTIKRYAALQEIPGREDLLVLLGMESVLSEWTDLAREFMESMFHSFFQDSEALVPWLKLQMEQLKAGTFDEKLEFFKKIRKEVSDYGKNPPAHIRAALLLNKPCREIRFVITKQGAMPQELKPSNLDYEYYILKQMEPVADLILGLSNKQLSRLDEPEQMGLF